MMNIDTNPLARSVAFGALLEPAACGPDVIVDRIGGHRDEAWEGLVLLQEDSLVTHEFRPVTRDLFFALSACWCCDQPEIGLSKEPPPGNLRLTNDLMLGLENVEHSPGWVLAGLHAAAAWGAPVGAFPAMPRHFYVPTEDRLRRAEHELGTAWGPRAGAVARVTPTLWITSHRVDATRMGQSNEHWPIVHPLVAALEIGASDPEVLRSWHELPDELGHRPWQ